MSKIVVLDFFEISLLLLELHVSHNKFSYFYTLSFITMHGSGKDGSRMISRENGTMDRGIPSSGTTFQLLYSIPGKYPHSYLLRKFVSPFLSAHPYGTRRQRYPPANLDPYPPQGYRSTDKVPLHFTTPTARINEPRKSNTVVIGEVVGVTAAGVAMAAVAVMAARDQAEVSP